MLAFFSQRAIEHKGNYRRRRFHGMPLVQQIVRDVEGFPVRQLHVRHAPRRPHRMRILEQIQQSVHVVLFRQRPQWHGSIRESLLAIIVSR